jgi:hypothetical protein
VASRKEKAGATAPSFNGSIVFIVYSLIKTSGYGKPVQQKGNDKTI